MAQINKPNTYLNTVLYSGNGGTQSITGVNFQPDLVYIKGRNTSLKYPTIFDSVRGASKRLTTFSNNAEDTHPTMLSSFDSDGWTSGSDDQTNASGTNYVCWNWLGGGTASSNTDGTITSNVSTNSTAGFSIVTYTGNGSDNATFGHGLGVTPDLIILKARGNTQNWWVSHKAFSSVSDAIQLNNTNPVANQAFAIKGKSATTITLGIDFAVNESGINYVSYCWNEIKGYSKFGSYTGNADNNGPFTYCGFSPALIIIKRTDTTGDWFIYDNKRPSYNVVNQTLNPNTSDVEESTRVIDILSNGFKQRAGYNDTNAAGGTYIYMAFAENPLVGTNNIPATAR